MAWLRGRPPGRTLVMAMVAGALLSGVPEGAAKTVIPIQKIQINAIVYFSSNQVRIPKASLPLLERLARVLLDHREITLIEVSGHCTPRESRYSRRFGLKRARNVVSYLVKRWRISPKRLVVKDYGPTRPMARNRTARGRAKNRRVDFRVLKVKR